MATVQRNDETLIVVFNDGYTIKLKHPDTKVLGLALANGRRDPNGVADTLIGLVVDGDKEKLKNTVAYLRQLSTISDDVFGKISCAHSWKDGVATIEFSDEKMVLLKPVDRETYSQAQVKGKQNPLLYAKHILSACWIEGDEDVKQSAGHLLGFSEILDSLLEYTGDDLGNF
ncbi:MAG: hypothetical protein JNM22_01855 [Saprospiraceae bacterium]|nr:hypothetical protein [Saprospiraceae bacterium]